MLWKSCDFCLLFAGYRVACCCCKAVAGQLWVPQLKAVLWSVQASGVDLLESRWLEDGHPETRSKSCRVASWWWSSSAPSRRHWPLCVALRLARSSGIVGIEKKSKMLWKWLPCPDLCLITSTCFHVMMLDKSVIYAAISPLYYVCQKCLFHRARKCEFSSIWRPWTESRRDGKGASCKLKSRKLGWCCMIKFCYKLCVDHAMNCVDTCRRLK